MDTINDFNPNDPMGKPTPSGSNLGTIGIVLGVLGLIVYCGPLAIAFVMGATGNAGDLQQGSGAVALSLISYCGAFISVIGAVLGGISLARGENKTFGIIAIVLGIIILCTCVVLAVLGTMMAL